MTNARTRQDWEKVARQSTFPRQAFIDGRYVDAAGAATEDAAMTKARSRADGEKLASQLTLPRQAFSDGRYVDAAGGATFDCHSPIDGRLLAKVADCGAEDVNRGVAVARKAYEDGRWSNTRPAHRKRVMVKLAQP